VTSMGGIDVDTPEDLKQVLTRIEQNK
jgi:hypothetical protein